MPQQRDGGLRFLFSRHLRSAWWIPIETWSTGQGVADTHYVFPGGVAGWIEFKVTDGWSVKISPEQIAWHERYARQGGRTFLAVRRQVRAGPRRNAADELWLYPGQLIRTVHQSGLVPGTRHAVGVWPGGPAFWPWDAVEFSLRRIAL